MNESDVNSFFERLVAQPEPDGIDLERALARGRGLGRRRTAVVVGSVLGAAVMLAGTGYGIVATQTDAAPIIVASQTTAAPSTVATRTTEPDHAPVPLTVTCTPDGISLSDTQVSAGPGGPVLRVSSTLGRGGYLNFRSLSASGGDPLPSHQTRWVRSLAPGNIELSCTNGRDPRPRDIANVTVRDPDGYWRGDTLGQRGCTLVALPDFVKSATADAGTAKAAVTTVASHLLTGAGSVTVSDAESGYPDAATQTWIMYTDGRARYTAEVRRTTSGFTAMANYTCG